MGFFKDFKDDLSQAAKEMMPGEEELDTVEKEEESSVNTLEGQVDVVSELDKLDGLLEQVTKTEPVAEPAVSEEVEEPVAPEPVKVEEPVVKEQPAPKFSFSKPAVKEEKKMADVTPVVKTVEGKVSDEVSIITEGTIITGDVTSNGSLDIRGQINGDVTCNGKLTVTGTVNGNSNTSEFFADSAQVEGEVNSTGTVKIGIGSVVIGNVTSTSAVIAGAIKGDIDVNGPVVVDTSAVVMGNIKSRSVQINNGAVIEGFCSQAYSDVDVNALFNSKKGN